MKVIYPIIITKTTDSKIPYFVSIPDLDGATQGTSVDNAIEMARDYIGLKVMDLQDENKTVPDSVYSLPTAQKNDIVTLVDVDITTYRKKHDNKAIKKTLTIPNYLNELGNEQNINFSETLTNALKKQLNVH
ncbi:type II toxin-antitoxin system HicB family antitoxin [Companilactobacillus furfuricola]|uniref:type II toxin-antitoxin system HicB family antitoxin n=1 Tax=Companilactobacillus furfuricola TaxID=1462575 RepID=UPI000F799151|nr:type II toxin-antitoxin system HicB family antitoxin [Companilactobacillus furfuricola]